MPATTPSEEDAVLDKLFTKDGVFAIEFQQASMLQDGAPLPPGFRAFYVEPPTAMNSRPYSSVFDSTASKAYRQARAQLVAMKLANAV